MLVGLAVAVSARAVQLAEVVDGETGDVQGTATVVLEDLVLSPEGTTTRDVGSVAGTLLLDGESVLADGRPPDVLERAGAVAVDTLELVGTDDDVGERRALLEGEDGVADKMLVSDANTTSFLMSRAVFFA